MNFYKKKNKKSAFSIKELASLLNVSEETIKELENGERNISGDTLEEYLKFVNMSENEKKIKKIELLNWLKNIDLKKMREEFGLESQRELANEVGIAQSVISCIENGAYESLTFLTLYKLNKFFTNDFNKKVKTEVEENIDYTTPSGFGVVTQAGSLMPCSEPIEESKHSSFEIPKECIVEAKPEMESSNVDEQNDLYTEEDLKLVEEEPISVSKTIPNNSFMDFISIKREQYEDMQAKIKRYEKIIDYILKSEN